MSNHYGRYYTDISQLPASAPTGWYTFYTKKHRQYVHVYVDQDYDGGGWVCVIACRWGTAGMMECTWDNAVNTPNYSTAPYNTAMPASGGYVTYVPAPDTYNNDLSDYNIFIGVKFWDWFGGRHAAGKISVAEYAAGTNGIELNDTGSHDNRSRWYFTTLDSTDYWKSTGATFTSNEVGTQSPGMYSYHFANGFKLSTYDADHDTYGTNCSVNYGSHPFWFGSCWSGNLFGHNNGPYWDSSGGGWNRQYQAVYIK